MLRRNGTYLHMDGVGQIDLHALARDKIFACAGLTRHLVNQRNALCLCREQVVVLLRRARQQLFGAGNGNLRVAEHDKCADVEIVSHLAKRQLAFDARDGHRICHAYLSSHFILSHLIIISAGKRKVNCFPPWRTRRFASGVQNSSDFCCFRTAVRNAEQISKNRQVAKKSVSFLWISSYSPALPFAAFFPIIRAELAGTRSPCRVKERKDFSP